MEPLRAESLGHRLPPGQGYGDAVGLVRALRDHGVAPAVVAVEVISDDLVARGVDVAARTTADAARDLLAQALAPCAVIAAGATMTAHGGSRLYGRPVRAASSTASTTCSVFSPSRPLQIGVAPPRMTAAKWSTWFGERIGALQRLGRRTRTARTRTAARGRPSRASSGPTASPPSRRCGSRPRRDRWRSSRSPARSAPSCAPTPRCRRAGRCPARRWRSVKIIAAVSSTGKPRVAFDVTAWTLTMSPTSASRLFTSWIRLSRIGPPPGCAPPPAAGLEVVVGLVEQRGADTATIGPSTPLAHDLAGLGHDRAVVAVMAGQHRHPGRFPGLDEPGGALDRVADRLLHDHRHAGRHALQPAVDVHLVRRGEDDPVGPVRPRTARRATGYSGTPYFCGQLRAGRAGVDDRRELGRGAGVDLLDVPLADQPGAGHGDPHAAHLRGLRSLRYAGIVNHRTIPRAPSAAITHPNTANSAPAAPRLK